MNIYVRSEAEEQEGNRDMALQLVKELHDLVRSSPGVFGPREAPHVGNAAVTAERFKDAKLANDLYRLAVELEPGRSNTLQNFADFIVQFQLKYLCAYAEGLLNQLETPPHDQHKPARTLALRARLAALRKSAEAGAADVSRIDPDELEESIAQIKENPEDITTFGWIAQALGGHQRHGHPTHAGCGAS